MSLFFMLKNLSKNTSCSATQGLSSAYKNSKAHQKTHKNTLNQTNAAILPPLLKYLCDWI